MQNTSRRVLDLLRVRGNATVEELARVLHLTRSTVRSQLMSLRAEGLVARQGTRPGKRRPGVVYVLTAAADSLFPQAHGEFAMFLVEEAKRGEVRDLEELLRRVGDRWIARDRPRLEGLTGHARVRRAMEILAERGFMPTLEQTHDGYSLREHNCPVMPLAASDVEVCDMVGRWMEALFGASLTRVKCMRNGDPFSAYAISARHVNSET
jgi:predicted ArsR family transcriptional regulator